MIGHPFGWSLPPGYREDTVPANRCQGCGQHPDNCDCPTEDDEPPTNERTTP